MDGKRIISYLKSKYQEDFVIINEYKQLWSLEVRYGVKSEKDIAFTVIVDGDEINDDYELMQSRAVLEDNTRNSLDNLDGSYQIEFTYKSNEPLCIELITVSSNFDARKDILKQFVNNGVHGNIQFTDNDVRNSIIYHLDENVNVEELINNSLPKTKQTNVVDKRLSDQQLERLCCLVYLTSILDLKNLGNLETVAKYILKSGYGNDESNGKYPIFMTKKEWDVVLNDVINDEMLGSLKVVKYIDINEKSEPRPDILIGHRVVCFKDIYNRAYVVYRGTASDAEWQDNGEGMLISDTVQQIAAAKFIYEVKEELDVESIIVAGHSKGANKAQYVTLAIPEDYIDYCLSLDGQGFSTQFMDKYQENIRQRRNKISLIAEQRDFVNCLGHYIENTTFYRGRRGDSRESRPYGDPIIYFHIPEAVRNQENEFGTKSTSGTIPSMLNKLVLLMLDDPKYQDIREVTIKSIVSLMMSKSSVSEDELAEAVANIIMAIFDIVNNNQQFNEEIEKIIYEETNTIIATIELGLNIRDFTSADMSNDKSIGYLIANKLVSKMMKKPKYLIYLATLIRKLLKLIKRILSDVRTDPKIVVYLGRFLLEVLDLLAVKIRNKLINSIIRKTIKVIERILFNDSSSMLLDNELDEIIEDWKHVK